MQKNKNIIDCIQIHNVKTNEQNESKEEESEMLIDEDKLNEIQNCDCGKPNKEGNFECFNCGKVFCEACPNRPLEDTEPRKRSILPTLQHGQCSPSYFSRELAALRNTYL